MNRKLNKIVAIVVSLMLLVAIVGSAIVGSIF